MKRIRMVTAVLAVGLVAGLVVAQGGEKPTPQPGRRGRLVLGGPFMRLKGLSREQREKLATLWTATNEKLAAARADEVNALKTYNVQGQKVLTNAQRKALADLRAAREARMKAARERKPVRPAERPKPRPALRGVRGALADLKDLTDEQVKRINDLAAKRAAVRKAAADAMKEKTAVADKAFQAGVAKVLTKPQRAALETAVAKAKAEREAAAKRAVEERAKRSFGGDFRRLKGLTDEQKLALGQLWRESQAASAAARKAEAAARAAYVTTGKKLLTAEQLKALEEIIKKSTAKPRRTRRAA